MKTIRHAQSAQNQIILIQISGIAYLIPGRMDK